MRWWGLAFALVLLSIWGRVYYESEQELERAQAAEAAGELETAIEHYQYAARWYSPLASSPETALDALYQIGSEARANGQSDLALKSFRRLRGAILATRGLIRSHAERLDEINQQIAELMADQQLERGDATVRGRDRDTLIAHHLRLLQLDPLPSSGWSLLVILSFLGWIVGVGGTIRRGMTADLEVNKTPFIRWIAVTVLSFVVWLFALSQA